MENHQSGKSTDLTFDPYNFDTGLTEAAFTSSRLNRAR